MRTLPKRPGVYLITSRSTKRIYVGSSVNMRERNGRHVKDLRGNKHRNIHLQRTFCKYGEDDISFSVLEIVEDVSNLLEREQHWMNFYNCTDTRKGFNVCATAGSNLGIKLTEEHKRNIGKALLGKRHTEDTKKLMSEAHRGRKYKLGFKDSAETLKKKSLARRGAKHPLCKLNDNDVKNIKKQLNHKSSRLIALEFGVSEATISNIKRGKSWSYITV